jgi:CheY-like chemotaxis protein
VDATRAARDAIAAHTPTVLVVDDHAGVLKAVSAVLSPRFTAVRTASSGAEALAALQHQDADLIVMDVTMPGLDGFQTAAAIRQSGSRARIVFLSMHEADEYVAEAFRAGAYGYVVKARMHADLVNALMHAAAGRLFMPSLKSVFVVANGGGGHAAQFYERVGPLLDELSPFVAMALQNGDAVSVVATAEVRAGLADRLSADGWQVPASGEHGRYRAFDAAETLDALMRDGRPDAELMDAAIADLERVRIATAVGVNPRLTLVGQIAVPLLENGDPDGAMEIERLWNRLTHPLPLLGICCYPLSCFAGLAGADLFSDVCAEHWAIGSARGLSR